MNSLIQRVLALSLLLFFSSYATAYIIAPTTPGKWGSPEYGTGATITWSLMDDGVSCVDVWEPDGCEISSLDSFMPDGWYGEIKKAFAAWSAVADLTFIEVPDTGEPFDRFGDSGDIRIGGHYFDGRFGTLAHGYFPPFNGFTAAGDIHFDTGDVWKIGFGGTGFDIFSVAAHEIGHALGLDHSNVSRSLMRRTYTESFHGLQPDDIAGIQFLYGSAKKIPEPRTAVILTLAILFLIFRKKVPIT